jgi:hypothetical protein
MILTVFTLLIMGVLAYAFWREGPLTAFATCVNVVLAGVLAFNFYEPLAGAMESAFSDSFLEGIEDAVALMLIFLPLLMLFRLIANTAANTHMEYPPILYRGGAVVFGLLAGYLLSGFLACMVQMLPLQKDFLGFEPYDAAKPVRKFLPPDVMWLAMMHRLSGAGLSGVGGDDKAESRFDKRGNFQLRYTRYRRFDESGKAMPWHGEVSP